MAGCQYIPIQEPLSQTVSQKADPTARRLASIPGVGAITARAIGAATPAVSQFCTARDDAASMGPTRRQHSNGGHRRFNAISESCCILVPWRAGVGGASAAKVMTGSGG